jgi:hypothetical protein
MLLASRTPAWVIGRSVASMMLTSMMLRFDNWTSMFGAWTFCSFRRCSLHDYLVVAWEIDVWLRCCSLDTFARPAMLLARYLVASLLNYWMFGRFDTPLRSLQYFCLL